MFKSYFLYIRSSLSYTYFNCLPLYIHISIKLTCLNCWIGAEFKKFYTTLPSYALSFSLSHSNRQNDKFVRKVFSICKSSRKLGQLSVGTDIDMGTYVPHSLTILPLCLRDLITYSINLICMQHIKRGKETHTKVWKQNTINQLRAESKLKLERRSEEKGYT